MVLRSGRISAETSGPALSCIRCPPDRFATSASPFPLATNLAGHLRREGTLDRHPYKRTWEEQLGREGICLHFLGAGLAAVPVDAHETADENWLAFVDQEVPDFVRDGEAVPRRSVSGVDAPTTCAAVICNAGSTGLEQRGACNSRAVGVPLHPPIMSLAAGQGAIDAQVSLATASRGWSCTRVHCDWNGRGRDRSPLNRSAWIGLMRSPPSPWLRQLSAPDPGPL